MSGKAGTAKDKNSLNAAAQDTAGGSGDFWGNFLYFLALTIAITFILANNTVAALTSHTGLIILGLLVLLDIFPAFHLLRHLLYGRE